MRTAIIIPARYASTRYPGKPLVDLRGASGISKSLVRRSWEAAVSVSGVDAVLVATDDTRIADHCREFGAEIAMTSPEAANGTERCAEVAKAHPDFDLYVNLQGDAPLTPADFVESLIAAMKQSDASMATPVLQCDAATLANFKADRAAGRVGGTTVVFDQAGHALYFSKEVIPYADGIPADSAAPPVYHHVGIYAYRPDALIAYSAWPEGPLEKLEGLEQLRFLENGSAIKCVDVEAKGRVFWELNNPVDVARIEAAMAEMGME